MADFLGWVAVVDLQFVFDPADRARFVLKPRLPALAHPSALVGTTTLLACRLKAVAT